MKKALGLLLVMFVVSCGSAPQSDLKGLAASQNGKNLALIFGAPNGLPGVPTDVREMAAMLTNPANNFHFTAIEKNKATIDDILKMSGENSKNADTLLWFFSGHGDDGGLLAEEGGSGDDDDNDIGDDDDIDNSDNNKCAPAAREIFTFKQVVTEIKKARGNKPLERLLVFLDSCYSGSFVDGTSAIIDETTRQEKWAEDTVFGTVREAYDQKLYKQAFVMASSLKTQTSEDLGEEQGGAFTYGFRMAMEELKENSPNATFKDLAELAIVKTKKVANHTPVYRAFPNKTVLNDKVFVY